MKSIYNDYGVELEITKSLELGSKVVVSKNDIECNKDRNLVLSMEAKDISNTNMEKSTPQLVAALLSHAFLKLRRNQDFNGDIEVFGLKLWGYNVSFFKANLKKDYLECLQKYEKPESNMATIWHYPKQHKMGFSLINYEERTKIIQTLYRLKNATRTDCISEYFLDENIKFDFTQVKNSLNRYSKIIEAVVAQPNNGMLAGGYFIRNINSEIENNLDLYICAKQLHELNGKFDWTTYLAFLSKQCKEIISHEEESIISASGPSYFAGLNKLSF